MPEIWKIVNRCPAYEVSSLGRLKRSLPNSGATVGSIISPAKSRGYFGATLAIDGRKRTVQIHRIVCEAFHGPAPTGKHHAAHLNGNSIDNRAENLAWVTAKENIEHKRAHGTMVCGERSHHAKLTEAAVREIIARHTAQPKTTFTETAREFGVDRTLVSLIVHRRIWKHIEV